LIVKNFLLIVSEFAGSSLNGTGRFTWNRAREMARGSWFLPLIGPVVFATQHWIRLSFPLLAPARQSRVGYRGNPTTPGRTTSARAALSSWS